MQKLVSLIGQAPFEGSVPTLYVKTAPINFDTRSIFALARHMSPCLLVLEDIDAIFTAQTRSYFFDEVNGLRITMGLVHGGHFLRALSVRSSTSIFSSLDRKYTHNIA